jgi:PAS domain S-box-containing protein
MLSAEVMTRPGPAPSNPLYAALIEHSLDLITVVDSEGTITFHSPSVERILGYSPVELLGTSGFDLVHPDDVRRVREEFDRAWRSSDPTPFVDYRIRHKNGSWRVLESIGRTVAGADGVVVGIVNSRDLTNHRALEEQFRRAQQAAVLGRFTASIAHEFRNALQVILGNLDFIIESETAPDILQPELQGIKRACHTATTLTRQLLDFGSERAPALQLVDVNETIATLSTMLQHLVGRDIRVVTALEAEDAVILSRAGALDQILVNLASNARDAIQKDGTLTIATRNGQPAASTLHRRCAAGEIVIEVTDDGAGMSPALQARIFEPYFSTKRASGTGLGLSTVRGMVEEAGGQVSVRSAEGAGTTFTVTWPLAGIGTANLGSDDALVSLGTPRAQSTASFPRVRNSGKLVRHLSARSRR